MKEYRLEKSIWNEKDYEQFVRQEPILTESQILSLDVRNGISFTEKSFDE